jgi:hypothetical protein
MKIKFKTSESFYKFLQKLLSVFELILLGAVKAYLNTQVGQSTLRKAVNWLVDNTYEQTFQPLLETLLVRISYKHDVKDGKIFIKRLKEAEEQGNEDDWDSTVDDINS